MPGRTTNARELALYVRRPIALRIRSADPIEKRRAAGKRAEHRREREPFLVRDTRRVLGAVLNESTLLRENVKLAAIDR